MPKVNSSSSMSAKQQNPKSPAIGAPASFRNPFEELDPEEVWKELLSEPMKPISRKEAIQRMIEADKNRVKE